MAASMSERRRQELNRRGLRLAYFTIVWDLVEGAVAVTAGFVAGSIALVGFGIDATIEVFAASVVAWQLKKAESGRRQSTALRLISVTFFGLAAYVGFESVKDLATQDKPDASIVGIVLNVVALAVMIPVARAKRTTGNELRNDVLIADSSETWLSNYLSASVLVGLGLNASFGWWWADPAVALLVAGLAVRSGVDAWQEASEERPELAPAGPQAGRDENREVG